MMMNGDNTSQLKGLMLIRVHCLFVVPSKKTYKYVPSHQGSTHNAWICQEGAGLEKRQCSLQVMFVPEGSQARLTIIFHGKGKQISVDEKMVWHPDVVFFQQNVWLDLYVCMHQMV